MKNRTGKFIVFAVIVALALIPMWNVPYGYCQNQQPKTVAICPFEMNAAQDLSFLQKGLFSMLSSRLADPGKVSILDREIIDKALAEARTSPETSGPLNEAKARLIAKGLGADYILFGSLTMFGSSVSLDTTMVDVLGEKPALTFSKQAGQPGAVITELDKIATQINYKTFNRRPEEFIPRTQHAQQPAQYQQGGETYASPLRNYRVIAAITGEVIGMSTADVDGDGNTEVVVVFPQGIEIFKDNMNGQLISLKKIEEGGHMDIVGVDTADINQNGTAEIFISRVHRESGFVKSYVLEFDGSAYKNISGILPWYLRVVKTENRKPELYGQKSGKLGPYNAKDVFRVVWNNTAYVKGEKLRVPDGFTVMSMATKPDLGNITGGVLYTDKQGRLTVLNDAGRVEWSGEEGYGGTKIFYEFKEDNEFIQDISEGKGEFLQPRNLLFDFQSDGKKEVFAIRNEDASGGLFSQIRQFKSGSIEILSWSEIGLSPARAPKKIPGQVTDIAFEDIDGNGKTELLVAFIKKRNNFASKKTKSMIVAYDME